MMERAIAEIVSTPSFQLDKASYHLDNIDTGKDLLYGVLADQERQI